MRKTLIFCVLSLLFVSQIYAITPARTLLVQDLKQNEIATTYNVRIRLVRTDGSPVTGSIGLRGFWARNEQTGVYYDPTDREGYEFEGLPDGTYTFGAYPGNWEGAVSKTVTLDPGQAGADGFIEVTLVYWVE
ncbi:hypothetical protein [Chitinophaga tropicalis]|uniref:Carboxypeptidase regulatory-like domain-containing protein n=1 Tax=Chitinophaga tropicalis TaxID=2683588 RepID=A0A7K1U313_9BACT|nr:hypothetical protein [Chitinophaga tropicalis]MVT08395.1 hypothetical protein [Chitinophaga tropicalis]